MRFTVVSCTSSECGRALCDHYPQLRLAVNFYDKLRPSSLRAVVEHDHRIDTYWTRGMRTLFWKKVLTPQRVSHLDVVWLFDCDLGVHPSLFPLGNLVGILQATNASLLQPSVTMGKGPFRGGHGSVHAWLHAKPTSGTCQVTTAKFVESMSPIFRAEAWSNFREHVLSVVADDDLAQSDYGLDLVWCAFMGFMYPKRPACLVVPGSPIIHFSTRSTESAGMALERKCAGTCHALQRSFRHLFQNFSHNTGRCWHVSTTGLWSWDATAVSDKSGVVVGRPIRGVLAHDIGAGEADEGDGELWLGATSVSAKKAWSNLHWLTSSLLALCAQHPQLRVLFHHFDALPTTTAPDDTRFEVSRERGGRGVF